MNWKFWRCKPQVSFCTKCEAPFKPKDKNSKYAHLCKEHTREALNNDMKVSRRLKLFENYPNLLDQVIDQVPWHRLVGDYETRIDKCTIELDFTNVIRAKAWMP